MWKGNVLIVDDEDLVRWSLEKGLGKEGYHVLLADTGELALKKLEEEPIDLILLDIRLPGISGMEVLQRIRENNSDLLVIMMTSYGDVEMAVNAMKWGAYDYVNKPFNLEDVRLSVRKALETIRLKKEVELLRNEQRSKYGFDNIIGISPLIREVFDMVKMIARSDATTVLLQGESGTGKDLLAKAIHYQSARYEKPFIAINCGAVPDTLLESELLGHEKGAFTDAKAKKIGLFEQADMGTIFLDEIGEMKMDMQVKLLRLIEDKSFRRVGGVKDIKVDVRIVAATNKDLAQMVKEGAFREDLYYRLKVFPIYVPPLRERQDDITLLINYFIDVFNKEFKKNIRGISPKALTFLQNYPWPGNVRELKNVIERAIILGGEDEITPTQLPKEIQQDTQSEIIASNGSFKLPSLGVDLDLVEKELIQQALERTGGNQTHAAKLLTISRDALRYRMQKHGLL
ncbi:MAG: sigma-54-dependent Fis family transcriptional regulator [Candidatus Tectomicrobia bacterium]|uniref:Sigma-54-dependent Fis family transcriptional regulator n=1 Tax=Tectimicrobiota bacterium TaxID=2528274 RepID=A0A932CP49_UNCTE|nr:sigma-54-dependent Fis family transcriptional regulator [Candidatus Tectomicrobia bacterium]